MMDHWQRLTSELQPLRLKLLQHAVYDRMRTLAGVRRFMEHHVFAVWDFMSLLKALQQRLCCVAVPWLPPENPTAARLINEIVLAEETDLALDDTVASHFDLYLDAMREAGANADPILAMFDHLRVGGSVAESLQKVAAAPAVCRFVGFTFETIEGGDLPSIAAAFTCGREDLLPGLFSRMVAELDESEPGRLEAFVYYLDRHVSLDGEDHGPKARALVAEICGSDPQAWDRARRAAVRSLEMRLELWDAMDAAVGRDEETRLQQAMKAER
jgi:hypothetical protein